MNFLVYNAPLIFGFFGCLLCAFRWHKFNTLEKLGVCITGFCWLPEVVATWLKWDHISTYPLYNLVVIPQVLLFCSLYYNLLNPSPARKAIFIFGILYFIGSILNLIFLQGLHKMNNLTYIPACLVVSLLAWLYLKQLVWKLEEKPTRMFLFWFSLATLIDYSISVPVLGTLTWLPYIRPDLLKMLYLINIASYSCWYLFIILGAKCHHPSRISLP